MGLTVGDVLEQTRSQFLQPGSSNQESWDVLDGNITDSVLTMTTEGIADYIAEGSVIEWDDATMEAALVKSSTGSVVTFHERGFLDTDPAAHIDGTRVIIDAVYQKKVLFDGLKSVISSLRGYGLYAKGTSTSLTYQTSSPITLPADAIGVAGEMYVANGTSYNVLSSSNYRVLQNFSPLKVQFLGGGIVGGALTIAYKKDFTQPDDVTLGVGEDILDVDLDDCGVSAALQQGLPLGIAAHVLSGRDIPQVDSEHVRRTQANQGIPVGTRTNLARTLMTQFVSGPVMSERVRLLETAPTTTAYERFI